MEDLNLTETETRYFGDLFLCCDEESNGKIPILKATELFRSSNIANDILKQIMDISVAPNSCASLNHMNRKQFYSSLKLIAAHQSNMTLKPDLLATSLDLPLPRFTWALNSDLIQLSSSPKEQHISKRERSVYEEGKVGAYEPISQSNLSDSDAPQTLSHDNTEALSTDSEMESENSQRSERSHVRRGKSGSPWSTASESPTPTNSVAERPHPVWEHSATGRGVWPVNTGEEHTQLLGTEEECSDRHSSDEETERVDVFAMSEAQTRHYAAQFAQLRPDRGLLLGHTARLFFEKSRLPVADLRKIWLLSDITKDGALSLEEFSIAMHLIVLRRNNLPVPDALPACLLPKLDSRFSRQDTTDLVDLGSDMFSSGTSADFNFNAPKPIDVVDADEKRPSLSPPKAEAPTNTNTNKQWTKFGDSPTTSPVNFDFQKSAVERDPKIYHPVALRATPDEEPRVIQRPQPKRDPPPPPPRPLRHHARSSSLDLNRLGTTVIAPPPPPRAEYESEGFGYSRDGSHGAFEVVRKSRDSEAEPEVKALREQNAVLHRVCRALCAELADVQREKQALRLRLDSTPV